MKEYLRHRPNANKHRHLNKGSDKIHKRGAKFNPKTWAYFNKPWAIGKNTVENFVRRLENPVNKKKTHNKPAQINTIENMEAAKARITAKSLFIVHSVCGRLEGAMDFAYDTVIRAELLYQYQEEAKSGWCLLDDSTK